MMGSEALNTIANATPAAASGHHPNAMLLPTRLIVGVDGTSCTPDGPHGRHFSNISNVYRICASAKEGMSVDSDNRWFVQKKKYFPGIGSDEKMHPLSRLTANISGKDCVIQISEVYEYCCIQMFSGHPENEIWFYGFSRGAYVVRAVAGLLHHLRALISAGTPAFKSDFVGGLRRYKDLRRRSSQGAGQIHEYLAEKTRPAPIIRFIGVFDTVKAVNDHSLYDISFNDSIQHFRQALALNEDRKDFSPECLFPELNRALPYERSLVQAWFLGAHLDIGGSAAKDGLSLYPLQWMLLESTAKGLELHFDGTFGGRAPIDDPITVVFPQDDADGKGKDMWSCAADNGVGVDIQDLRKVHELPKYGKRYSIHLNRDNAIFWIRNSRQVFALSGELRGYCSFASQGTILHPSIYMILDTFPHMLMDSDTFTREDWQNIYHWKTHILALEWQCEFWDDRQTTKFEQPGSIRILVCGNTGVGKSSLINAVFGAEVTTATDRTRGSHNVEDALTNPNRPDLLIHDSGGFEAGGTKDLETIEKFVKERSNHIEIYDRLHVIWFCLDLGTVRTRQTATIELFETVSRVAKDVPIVVVATKKDVFLNEQAGKKWRELKKSGGSPAEVEVSAIIDEYAEDQSRDRMLLMESELLSIEDGRFDEIVGVHKGDPESLQALSDATRRCFDDDKLRISFIAAQTISMDMKVDKAILDALQIYKRTVTRAMLSDHGADLVTSHSSPKSSLAAEVCAAVVASFGLPTISASTVEHIICSKLWKATNAGPTSSSLAIADAVSKAFLTTLSVFDPCSAPAIVINAVQTNTKLFLALVCDVILILVKAFKESAGRCVGQPLQIDINKAAFWYRGISEQVHKKLNEVIPTRMYMSMYMHRSLRTGPIRQKLLEVIAGFRITILEGETQIVSLGIDDNEGSSQSNNGEDRNTECEGLSYS